MRRIAVLNQKGGVGKTTTAVNVAAALVRDGLRVMLIDLDPQSHATLHLGVELGPDDLSVHDMLMGAAPLAEIARHVDEQLTVIPANLTLVAAELGLAERDRREHVLADALDRYREAFDVCIIDCAPSLGLLTLNALVAAHEVIIPLQAHFLALQGLGRLLETVTLVRDRLNPRLCVSGVVLCMFDGGTRLAEEVRSDVEQFLAAASEEDPWFGARLFGTPIRRNIKLAECPSFGQTIFEYAPYSNGGRDYAALATEIIAHGATSISKKNETKADDEVVVKSAAAGRDGVASRAHRREGLMEGLVPDGPDEAEAASAPGATDATEE